MADLGNNVSVYERFLFKVIGDLRALCRGCCCCTSPAPHPHPPPPHPHPTPVFRHLSSLLQSAHVPFRPDPVMQSLQAGLPPGGLVVDEGDGTRPAHGERCTLLS